MARYDFLREHETREITQKFSELCKRYDIFDDPRRLELAALIARGIAYHHAGMLPVMKEIIEQLFTSRLLKVIFTTETFALGINMPARTVCFDELRKFYGFSFAALKTRDFYQMAGRAGRRGIDKEGFVCSRINPHYISIKEIQRIIYGNPERIRSKFNTSYSTLLLLYKQHGENLLRIYPDSFHYFQQKKTKTSDVLGKMKARVHVLKNTGCIRKNRITPKGLFASKICGYELPLSHLYDNGTLENLSTVELGIICLAIVYEPRKGTNRTAAKPDRRLKNIISATKNTVKTINRMERKAGIYPYSKQFQYHLLECIKAWMHGTTFEEVLAITNADEGEIVRFFRMAIQIMREIINAEISEKLRNRLRKAISMINRDVIDAEKQLRS